MPISVERARARGAAWLLAGVGAWLGGGAVAFAIGPAVGATAVGGPSAGQNESDAGARADEPRRSISMLANGVFDESLPAIRDGAARVPIPWWRTRRGAAQLTMIDGAPALVTEGADFATQPIAGYAPLAGECVLRGVVRGRGRIAIRGSVALAGGEVGERREAVRLVGREDGEPEVFELRLAELAADFDGRPPVPRFELELRAAVGGCAWSALDWSAPWPEPSLEDLRAELEAELDWILDLWLTRARDDVGPEHTAFLASLFDVCTGERLMTLDGGHNSFVDLLGDALAVRPRDDWRRAYVALSDDILSRGLHPETGLPRMWDTARDRPKNEQGVEIAPWLSFLLDLSEGEAEGRPEELRERAERAAARIGATVLAKGLMPDGGVAAKFRPSDGEPNTHLVHLRRLDIAAQLGRLARRTGDERSLDAAREAAALVEYTHYWPGGWSDVDPGFDDIYGHFGARAVTLWRAFPGEPIFRRLALGGYEHYERPWRDACRIGGNVAADQVRCWEIVLDMTELEPALEPRIAVNLAAAVRAHLQGEQYGNGAWGDVTIFGFDPQDHLQVGDLPGTPQNLLQGLAWATRLDLTAAGGPSAADLRALFLGVLRSTQRAYKREFGYLSTRVEAAGANPARGSIGVATGIVALLEHLDRIGS